MWINIIAIIMSIIFIFCERRVLLEERKLGIRDKVITGFINLNIVCLCINVFAVLLNLALGGNL